jgi:hypothetical protein
MFNIDGKVVDIVSEDIESKKDPGTTYPKIHIVVDIGTAGETYKEIAVEFFGRDCDKCEGINRGDHVVAYINLKGGKGANSGRYWLGASGVSIERVASASTTAMPIEDNDIF